MLLDIGCIFKNSEIDQNTKRAFPMLSETEGHGRDNFPHPLTFLPQSILAGDTHGHSNNLCVSWKRNTYLVLSELLFAALSFGAHGLSCENRHKVSQIREVNDLGTIPLRHKSYTSKVRIFFSITGSLTLFSCKLLGLCTALDFETDMKSHIKRLAYKHREINVWKAIKTSFAPNSSLTRPCWRNV